MAPSIWPTCRESDAVFTDRSFAFQAVSLGRRPEQRVRAFDRPGGRRTGDRAFGETSVGSAGGTRPAIPRCEAEREEPLRGRAGSSDPTAAPRRSSRTHRVRKLEGALSTGVGSCALGLSRGIAIALGASTYGLIARKGQPVLSLLDRGDILYESHRVTSRRDSGRRVAFGGRAGGAADDVCAHVRFRRGEGVCGAVL